MRGGDGGEKFPPIFAFKIVVAGSKGGGDKGEETNSVKCALRENSEGGGGGGGSDLEGAKVIVLTEENGGGGGGEGGIKTVRVDGWTGGKVGG